jgi:hypothetical protein
MVLFICFIAKVEQNHTLQDVTWTVAEAEGGWRLSLTTGETVYHVGWYCFRSEKVWTVTDYSKRKCNTYCSKMAKLTAPILPIISGHFPYWWGLYTCLQGQDEDKTHNMHCRASNRMLVEIPISRKCLVYAWSQIGRHHQFYLALWYSSSIPLGGAFQMNM